MVKEKRDSKKTYWQFSNNWQLKFDAAEQNLKSVPCVSKSTETKADHFRV